MPHLVQGTFFRDIVRNYKIISAVFLLKTKILLLFSGYCAVFMLKINIFLNVNIYMYNVQPYIVYISWISIID